MKTYGKRLFCLYLTIGLLLLSACSNEATVELSDSFTHIEDEKVALASTSPIKETVLTYEGTGDSVIELDDMEDPWVLYVKGNASKRHFAVKGYDINGKKTELFVNTTDQYEGITLDPMLATVTLEIKSNGKWLIEKRSARTLDIVGDGESYSGTGDCVFLLSSYGKTATISGNKGERHFAIKSYGSSKSNLLVNTTDKYEGTVMLKNDPFMIEVTAVGDWTIQF